MKNVKPYLKRLKNPATVIGICGYSLSIISCIGIEIQSDVIMSIMQSVCGICVLLGIMNNPDTKGIDMPIRYTKN